MAGDDNRGPVWLTEAMATVEGWEKEQPGRLLSTREAIVLARNIADALERAYERGIAQRESGLNRP